MRMIRSILVLSLALLPVLPVAAQTPLERTSPSHQAPVPPGGYNLPLAPPVMRFPLPPQLVIVRSNEDWRKFGTVVKPLSDACAARQFREQLPKRFRAIFKGEVLGVAFGHGLNLVDPDKKADKSKIYLFRNGDSTACMVIAIDNQDLNLLRALAPDAGSAGSAAPAPPGANSGSGRNNGY